MSVYSYDPYGRYPRRVPSPSPGRYRSYSPAYSDHGDYGRHGGVYSSRIYPARGERFSRRDVYDGDIYGHSRGGSPRRGDVLVRTINVVRPPSPPTPDPVVHYRRMPTPPPKEPPIIYRDIIPPRAATPPPRIVYRKLPRPPTPEPEVRIKYVQEPRKPTPPPRIFIKRVPGPPTPEPETFVKVVRARTPPTPPPVTIIKRLPTPPTPEPERIIRHIRARTPPTPPPIIENVYHPPPPPPDPGVIIREIVPPPPPPQPPQLIYKVTPPAPPPRLALRPVPKQNPVIKPIAVRAAAPLAIQGAQPQQTALMLRPVQGAAPVMMAKPIGQPMAIGGQPIMLQGAQQQPMYVTRGVFNGFNKVGNGSAFGTLRTM